jgi:hypothetical protein
MKAVYNILTCCGDLVERVEYDVPAGCADPADYEAETGALESAGYDRYDRCSCGTARYRARFAGYALYAEPGVKMRVEAPNRDVMIMALEAVVEALRSAPEDTALVEVDEKGGRME